MRDGSAATLASPLPAEIKEELVGAPVQGLLGPIVSGGLGVHSLLDRGVDGPEHRRNPSRTAKRHGHERGSMTLVGWRVEVEGPRTVEDKLELLPVQTYAYVADGDPLARAVMAGLIAVLSTRKYAQRDEPVGEDGEDASSSKSKSTSKSKVSELVMNRPAPSSRNW